MTLFPSFSRRARADVASQPPNVAIIMIVMMSLVFGPIIVIHLVANFAPSTLSWTMLSRYAEKTVPRG